MNTEVAHRYVDHLAKLLELAGVGIILLGVVLATVWFLRDGRATGDWRDAYEHYRSNLGRGILLGLDWSDTTTLRGLAREALDGGAENTRALLRDPDPKLKARGELFAFAVLMLRTMQESAETGLHTHGGPAWKAFGRALIEEAGAAPDQASGDSSP